MRIRITWQIAHFQYGYLKFKKRFEKMYGELPTHRAKKKLKSVWHYLVNGNEKEAWHFYRQLEKEYDTISGAGD